MTSSVIVAGARTPIGRFGGGFKDLPAVKLGGRAIKEALARSGVAASEVDYVIMGQVLQAGAGQITAPQAALPAGGPPRGPFLSNNKSRFFGVDPHPPAGPPTPAPAVRGGAARGGGARSP